MTFPWLRPDKALADLKALIEAGFFRIGTRMSKLDDELAALAAEMAAFKTTAQASNAMLVGIGAAMQRGVDHAANQGANDDQLSLLQSTIDSLHAQTSSMNDAMATASAAEAAAGGSQTAPTPAPAAPVTDPAPGAAPSPPVDAPAPPAATPPA